MGLPVRASCVAGRQDRCSPVLGAEQRGVCTERAKGLDVGEHNALLSYLTQLTHSLKRATGERMSEEIPHRLARDHFLHHRVNIENSTCTEAKRDAPHCRLPVL